MTPTQDPSRNADEAILAAARAILAAEDDERRIAALRELFDAGFEFGFSHGGAMLKDMALEFSKIVVARIQGDTESLVAVIDDFMDRHAIVTGSGAAEFNRGRQAPTAH